MVSSILAPAIMAVQVSKHCWATPKCGITTARRHFRSNKAVDYKFIIVRNPYYRLVSFYTNKVVKHPLGHRSNRGIYTGQILHLGKPTKVPPSELSFSELVMMVCRQQNKIRVGECDPHLRPQWCTVDKIPFQKVVKCENFVEDIREVCEILDVDYDDVVSGHENRTNVNDTIDFSVYDKPASWFRENGVPSNYDLFYDDKLRIFVYEIYEKDFELFEYDAGWSSLVAR